jgi:hypothetical protein
LAAISATTATFIRFGNWPVLCGFPIVVAENAAQLFMALDRARLTADFFTRFDQPVFQSLVVPFSVEMVHVNTDGTTQALFAEENHPI